MKFTNTDRKWFNQVFWRMDEQVYGQKHTQVNWQVRGQVKWLMFVQIIPIQNKIKQEINK